jgi:SAM-dependent methyltransferase
MDAARHPPMSGRSAYRGFWDGVGDRFPDLGGALSTRYYAECERRLFEEHFPALEGLKIFKTDLWDEAKNTRILVWAAEHGAIAYGLDLAEPTVRIAAETFRGARTCVHAAVADVRAIPFRDGSFDAVYSMGTIEHFDETEQAVAEIVRVLRPGGRAIVGVPNRRDPFLRPLLVRALQAFGLYAYGDEKCYTRRELRTMLQAAGLTVVAETAILFIPGWLRMLDLACASWFPPLGIFVRPFVRLFMWLDGHVPAVRRHGYLLASVGVKPTGKQERSEGSESGRGAAHRS